MMYQGIDLSRFKKIAGDGKSSKLKHSKGHEVTIAHSAVSPEMRQHLQSMPVHMAEGGDPTDVDPESPAPVEEPAPEAAAPAEVAPVAAPSLPPKPAVMPNAGTIDVVAPRRPYPTAAELDRDDAHFAGDWEQGRIQPKTMADLYDEKSTIGKIGTIFGLIVGGAGAGLTHGTNALLEMMQKDIDRDLDAQKSSATNKQSWYRLSLDHARNQADIRKMGAEQAQTEAQTEALKARTPAEIAKLKADTEHTRADADLIATSAARNRMQIDAYHRLVDMTNKMPPGPQKANATNLLQTQIAPAIMQGIKDRNAQTEGQLNLRSAVRGDAQKEPPQENEAGVDLDKMQVLAQQGQMAEQLGLPGGMRGSDVSAANAEAAHVSENRAIAKMFVDAFNRLDTDYLAGRLNPNQRDAEIASLGQQMAQRVGNSVSQKEYERILKSMFPEATDWGSARDAKFRHGLDALKSLEAGTPTLDRFGLKTEFPTYARARKKKGAAGTAEAATGQTNQAKDGDTATSKSGKPIIYKNGKWVYK